jgi:hypothetical protein
MKWLAGVLVLVACGSGVCHDTGAAQCQDCKDFVACSYKAGATPGSLDSTYGPNGSCWMNSTTSDNCTAACMNGNHQFQSNGVGADAGCLFGM